MNKSVFVIILNWNGWRDTVECVRSCRELTYPNFELLVVDNGSEDGSVKELRRAFPDLALLETGRNLGFAGGNNIGIRHALFHGAGYVWLLNNDTAVDPEALTELMKVAEAGKNTGMVGSKILTFSNPAVLHFAGGKVDRRIGYTTHLGTWEKDAGQYDHLSEVDYVTGCSMLVERRVIEKIGLMPEEYFLYFEETDWCLRARNAGFSIRMAPRSRVLHKVSASIDYLSDAKFYYLTRNRLYFLQKHGRKVNWPWRMLTDFRHLFYFVRTGRFSRGQMVLKAYRHWISGRTGPLHDKPALQS